MAKFSLIDINGFFKQYNGAPKFDKYSYRAEFFPTEPPSEEELYLRRYALFKPQHKDESAKEEHEEEPEPSFYPEEHRKVERMKPYIKQIIKDMKTHT